MRKDWRNYTLRYTDVDKEEFIKKMKAAIKNTVFIKPLCLSPECRVFDLLTKIEGLVSQLF